MDDQNETRIIIRRGKRFDLRTTLDVYEPRIGKLTPLNIAAGPSTEDIDRHIHTLKRRLEKAGNFVTFKEM